MESKKKLCVSVIVAIVVTTVLGIVFWQLYVKATECKTGLKWDWENRECVNIDECYENTDNCQHVCRDTFGGFECDCCDGYTLEHSNRCVDVDECEEGTHNCEHICENTSPGFSCLCRFGYQRVYDGSKCRPICSGTHSCDDRGECISPDECRCHSGYTGSTSGCKDFTCGDCENGRCIGPNQCRCNEGFRKINGTCTNIDECAESSHNCSQECRDLSPGFECLCYDGYRMSNSICVDIDECLEDEHACEHSCNNTSPGYTCSCNDGYEVADDRHVCKPICSGAHSCGVGGECVSPNQCRCYWGYNGSSSGCREFLCVSCDHGNCTGPNQCTCDHGFDNESGKCVKASSADWKIVLIVALVMLVLIAAVAVLLLRKHQFICRNSDKTSSLKYSYRASKEPEKSVINDGPLFVQLP